MLYGGIFALDATLAWKLINLATGVFT